MRPRAIDFADRDRRFDADVRGRTVAIVGPATPVGDQSAEIDAHDLVVRFEWLGAPIPGMGTRTDIVYYNRSMGGRMRPDQIPDGLLWVCYRDRAHARSDHEHHRAQRCPPRLRRPNLVPISAYDCALAGAAAVTIFGANFYLDARPYYDHSYLPARLQRIGNRRLISHTVSSHDQIEQRRFMRKLMAEHPQISGDQRFTSVLTMDDGEYLDALADLWQLGSRLRPRRASRRQKGPREMGPMNTWAHKSDGRIKKVRSGTQIDRTFARLPDWVLRAKPETDDGATLTAEATPLTAEAEPPADDAAPADDGPAVPDVEILTKRGGWREVIVDGVIVGRVRSDEEAEALAAKHTAELAAVDKATAPAAVVSASGGVSVSAAGAVLVPAAALSATGTVTD